LHLDMGEYAGEGGSWIKLMFTDDLEHFHEIPSIFCFDEFQFARTIDNNENELNRDKMRVIWELIDSGKIYYEPNGSNYFIKRAEAAIQMIGKCIRKDAILHEGQIIGNEKEFLSIFSGYYFDCSDRYGQDISSEYFLSKDFTEGIKELFEYSSYSDVEIQDIVKGCSLTELADWIFKGIKKQLTIKQLDLSKALIFVLGNLDEAFYMSDELSPDISADEFYEETAKIHIADIKSALKKRFRNEQIARLGNNHLIYPCFNSEGYSLLIQRNLQRISAYIDNTFGIKVTFHESVLKVVYNEGVFPAQGARPVLTTIKQMVESYVGTVMCYIMEKKLQVTSVDWRFQVLSYLISFKDEKGSILDELKLTPKLRLNDLSKPDSDDVQLHTAIHESGHAIVAALTLRIIPSMVITKTVSNKCAGFCQINLPEKLSTKGIIRKQIMIALAGHLAEKLILGDENISTGVCFDIDRATELANRAIKEYAMGNDPVRIHVESSDNNDYFFNQEKYATEAMNLINTCTSETIQLLNRNKLLLLKMAQYLTEHSVMREQAIGEMILYYGTESWLRTEEFIRKEHYFRFKEMVQNQIKELEKIQDDFIPDYKNISEYNHSEVLEIE